MTPLEAMRQIRDNPDVTKSICKQFKELTGGKLLRDFIDVAEWPECYNSTSFFIAGSFEFIGSNSLENFYIGESGEKRRDFARWAVKYLEEREGE